MKEDNLIEAAPNLVTPWRALIIGDELADIMESNLIENLNPPSEIANEDWIEPGVAVFPWWGNSLANDDPEIMKEYIDMCEEVHNYINAQEWAINELDKLPLSSRLIKETHKILLQGVRGEKKQPGEFRTSQNWIGGATINDATFIPPVHTSVPELMSDIEKFIHNNEIFVPELLKIGIVHYQFETISPFLDGNGRIGRLLIPLYLVNKGILKKPILYLSEFFEKHRQLYYDNLMIVRKKSNLSQWFKFFLVGIIETSKNGIKTFDNILRLQKQVESEIQRLGSRVAKAKKVIDYLYQRPIVDAEKVSEVSDISMPSSYKLISDLEEMKILKEVTGGQRSRTYVFENYLRLFR